MISKTYVLGQVGEPEELLAALDSVCDVINHRLGLMFAYAGAEDGENARYSWWVEYAENLGWLRLVDDFRIPAQYLEVSLPNLDFHAEVGAALAERLPLLTCDELKRQARHTAAGAAAIARLGLGCQGDDDPEVRSLVEAGLRSGQLEMRENSALAVFLLRWPQFEPAVRATLETETDADLKLQLAYVARLLQQS